MAGFAAVEPSVPSLLSAAFLRFIQLVSDWMVTFLYPVPTPLDVGVRGDMIPVVSFIPVAEPGGEEVVVGGDEVEDTPSLMGASDLDVVDVGVGGRGLAGTGLEVGGVGGSGLAGTEEEVGGVGGRGLAGVEDDDSAFAVDDVGVGGSGFVLDN